MDFAFIPLCEHPGSKATTVRPRLRPPCTVARRGWGRILTSLIRLFRMLGCEPVLILVLGNFTSLHIPARILEKIAVVFKDLKSGTLKEHHQLL